VSDPSSPLGTKTRERLVEASRLATVGRLVPSLVHQLSTPFAAIALRAESLVRTWPEPGEPPPEKARRYLDAIVSEAETCRELLSLVRDFARPAAATRDAVDPNGVCRGAARIVFHEAMRRQVEVRLDLADGLPAVQGEEGRLRQAVLALVLNAVDASPAGGHVDVATRAEAGAVLVAVSDQGPGVAAGDEPRLGEAFFSTRPGGLGLGLLACRTIAEAHGGSLDWESPPGRGSRFRLKLPTGRTFPEGGA
jgi:signal transduction histidine kinase